VRRRVAERTVLHLPARPHSSLEDIVRGHTLRLREAVARATRARGEEIIAAIFASARMGAGRGAARRRAASARRGLVGALTRQLLRQIEKAQRARVRAALAHERAARAALAADENPPTKATLGRRPRRRPVRPPPPPLDPEQIKRDAEFARLRALLRPTAEELPAVPPAPATPAPIPGAPRPATPGEFLRALEKEIQDAVPFLGRLGPERCGAQIAAWSGQVRELRDRLPPEVSAAMRPATRIFLEHLTELRAAMEASFVDALEPKWKPPSWSDYIEVNRARAERRPPALPADRLEAHHRAMLKALLQPHRRNVPEQAVAIIDAAAEVLPADDGQLRSARRRHGAGWRATTGPETEEPKTPAETESTPAPGPDATPPGEGSAEPTAAAPCDAMPEPAPDEASAAAPDGSPAPGPAAEPAATTDAPAANESEFEQPWTK
jgi:hypothetical protein